MSETDSTVQWLLEGDPAIRWQTLRDLAGASDRAVQREQSEVAEEGWGARLLERQEASGRWTRGIYTPKWTSTTYTIVLLHSLGLPPEHPQALKGCRVLLDKGESADGGFNCWKGLKHSETCVTGMILGAAAYFRLKDDRLHRYADYLLGQQMKDGGWNCRSYWGATHSSMHTTILALEGLLEYERYTSRNAAAVREVQDRGREFLLRHRLFKSHRTGKVIKPEWTRFSFPPRWHYDVLRGLDYFRACNAPRDERLMDAVEIVRQRRRPDGRWILQNRYPGKTFFEMERVGQPSRWNTLRALRVLKWWEAPAGPIDTRAAEW
ncbi:MAG: hypothetical protein ACE145_11780 [Terriglobia bacterium]